MNAMNMVKVDNQDITASSSEWHCFDYSIVFVGFIVNCVSSFYFQLWAKVYLLRTSNNLLRVLCSKLIIKICSIVVWPTLLWIYYALHQFFGNKTKGLNLKTSVSRKQSPPNFWKDEHFLGKKCSFFGKFEMLCCLETPILRFALLAYYRRIALVF